MKDKVILLLFLLICSNALPAQERSRIQGRVTNSQGKGIPDVNVIKASKNERMDMTDREGNYSILIRKSEQLRFSCVGYKEKLVNIDGRQIINVTLEEDVVQLDEVMVVSQIKNKVVPEPTDIEIKGNYFHLKTRVPIPKEMFNTHRRLILQPSIYDVTAKKRLLLRPLVFDGESYHITQKRMYDYDLTQDPLNKYIQVKQSSHREKDIISYHDSLYIEQMKHDYRADVNVVLENYHKVVYRDSFSIAQGTVNPLRMLDYSPDALPLTNERYLPKPMMQLMDTKGEVNLTFVIGSAELDKNNPMNQREIDRLKGELNEIEMNADASLRAFRITGVASPDGAFESNLRLAHKRTDLALERILAQIGQETRKHLNVKSEAEVAPWEAVVDLLRKDSRAKEADEIQTIIEKYRKQPSKLFRALRSMKIYAELSDTYLPKLRKVHYTYEYSIFRHLTDEEIKQLYSKNPKNLTRFEYYRMIATASEKVERERLCNEALTLYPDFMYAANELALVNIRRGTSNSTILASFVDKKAPTEILVNQTIALLDEGKYQKADSVISLVSKENIPEELYAYTQAFAGNYDAAFNTIAQSGAMNEVIMLLAMKRNKEAWEKAQKLNSGTAKEYYVKAIAANRLDMLGDALIYIDKALKMDPSLLETAKIDGDVIDLLPEDQRLKK